MMTAAPGLVEQAIGAAPAKVTIGGTVVTGNGLGPVSIRRGRSRPDDRYAPATASFTVLRSALPALPTLGQSVILELTPEALAHFGASDTARVRFSGRITDAHSAPPRRGQAAQVAIVATGNRSRFGQVKIADAPWPAELDGARAARILTLANGQDAGITLGVNDPGVYTVLALDIDNADPGALLDQLAADTGGDLVETRAGLVRWADANARGRIASALTLAANDVINDLRFGQVLAGMLNDLRLEYGGAGAFVQVTDTVAIGAGVGRYASSQTSQISSPADASSRATDLVGRKGRPRWRCDDGLTVDLLRTLDPAQAAALLQADLPAILLTLTGFPAEGPFITGRVWVEGWTETLTRDHWRLALDVSEYGETAPAPRWADVPTSYTWATMPADLSWLGAVSWYPGDAGAGRYLDQASDLDWDAVNPALTWATYP